MYLCKKVNKKFIFKIEQYRENFILRDFLRIADNGRIGGIL